MNGVDDKVLVAKNALMTSLGDNFFRYLANLKMWFRHKWTKDEFDRESRKLLTIDQMQLHNKFFMAMLNKMDVFKVKEKHNSISSVQNTSGSSHGSRSRKRKRGSRSSHDRVSFEPYDLLDFIVEDNMAFIRAASTNHIKDEIQIMPTQRYCVQEFFLPDAGFLLGRFLIGAWEIGLNTVDEHVAEYMMVAIQVLLKNLVSAIIMKRQHYKLAGDAYFYDIGAPLKDPSLRNTVTRNKVDDATLELDKEITSPNFLRRTNEDGVFLSVCEESKPRRKNLITLRDAQLALNNRNMLLSHIVYALNVERLTQMLH